MWIFYYIKTKYWEIEWLSTLISTSNWEGGESGVDGRSWHKSLNHSCMARYPPRQLRCSVEAVEWQHMHTPGVLFHIDLGRVCEWICLFLGMSLPLVKGAIFGHLWRGYLNCSLFHLPLWGLITSVVSLREVQLLVRWDVQPVLCSNSHQLFNI